MNHLARHLTAWRWWYALPALPALLIGSTVAFLAGESLTWQALLVPVQFLAFAFLALAFLGLLARRWPTVEDLGLRPRLSRRDLVVLAVAFAVTHLAFSGLGRLDRSPATRAVDDSYFVDSGLDGPLLTAFAMLFASVVLAGVCEEVLYRGALLRPLHDHLARSGRAGLGAAVGIAVSTLAFAMPHLGPGASGYLTAAYLLTGVSFGLVYVLTGSLTAVMVSHALQSCVAFTQVLLGGRAEHDVSPLLWVLVLGCPLWVFLAARLLHAVLPHDASAPRVEHVPLSEGPG